MDASTEQRALSIAAEPVDGADAEVALQQYINELQERFPAGFDPERAVPPAPGDFDPPHGYFLLVRDADGRVSGCGAVRAGGGIAEIRRMWISPALRGQGAGRRLLRELEQRARDLGCGTVRLDTAAELNEARRLYASAGYTEIPAYNDNEYARHWFEKALD